MDGRTQNDEQIFAGMIQWSDCTRLYAEFGDSRWIQILYSTFRKIIQYVSVLDRNVALVVEIQRRLLNW